MSRKKQLAGGKGLLNIRLLFILVTFAEILGTLILSSLLVWLSRYLFDRVIEVPAILWLLFFSVAIGLAASVVVNILLLKPVVQIGRAMQKVADGDFTIQLKSKTGIREIRAIYDSYNLMTRELQATETLQSDFVSNVSHEFKTPINAIEGYATLLQGSEDNPQQQEYVDRILLNTHRLSALVGNILLLSKVSSHAIPMNYTTYRLDEQIRQALVLLEPAWSGKDTEFDADMDELLWTGPESLMHHVWSNLISNAVKFGPHGGLIRMSLHRQDEQYVFSISDCGPGIPKDEHKRIFNRFYQLDSSHKQEGNGLGLALCRQILDVCGGSIQVENQAEGGCTFHVCLPANIQEH